MNYSLLQWRLRVRIGALLLTCATASAGAQTGSITGAVVADESGVPLAFSVVRIVGGAPTLTSESGNFRLTGVHAGSVRLRAQHIGYLPKEVDVDVHADAITTVRIQMSHVPVRLAEVRVLGNKCTAPGQPRDSATVLATIFQQLVLNAQQFGLFNHSYPFTSVFTRRFSRQYRLGYRDANGAAHTDSVEIVTRADAFGLLSDAEWHYAPGKVIARDYTRTGARAPAYGVNIPTLAVFADEAFIASHCFWDAGETVNDGKRERQVDFAVAESVDGPDLNGSLFLDPTTFVIRRSIVSLSRGSSASANYDSVSVETAFAEIAPGVAIIAGTRGNSTMTATTARERSPEAIHACLDAVRDIERQQLTQFQFRDTATAMLRIAVADALFAASSGPPSARRLLQVVERGREPVVSAQVRDSASGTAVFTGDDGTVDLAWFPQSDSLTLLIDRPGFQTARVSIPGTASDPQTVTVELVKGDTPFRDPKPPFIACR